MPTALSKPLSNFIISLQRDSEAYAVETALRDLHITRADVSDFCCFDESTYTRNLVHFQPEFEVVVMGWAPQQKSVLHDHGGQQCWMYVIEGELEEHLFDVTGGQPTLRKIHKIKPGQWSYVDDKKGAHLLKNNGTVNAVSLYIYAAPIESFNEYTEDGRVLERSSRYTPPQKAA